MNKSPKTALSPTFQPPHLPSPIGIPRSSHLSPETNIKIQNQFIYSNLKEYRCKPQNSPVWLVQGAAIYINIAAPCTTEIHTENQHLTLLVKPRVQPRFLHHLLILCFSCNPVIPKNKKSPKHFPFSVKIPIFASVPRAERSNAAKPAQLPNRYRLPNFLLFKSYLPTDYKKTIVFMRKARKNTVTRQVIHIVGEGLTELFYFSHLKKILGYRYSISPRLFENNSIEKIEKKIKELLDEDVFVICVFDADVSRRSDAENKKMVSFKKKYENNANVILCDSLQSIEYWFLLHFEDTCRHFQDSAATERALKQYLPTYDKTRKYLEKDKWVKEMLVGSKMDKACELAEKYKGRDSYSEIYKAIKKVSESLQ